MKQLLWLVGLTVSLTAHAATEAEFQKCVQIKEITASIAEQADQGISRTNLKGKYARSTEQLIDWVYDFRGAFSTQQLAQKQMDICLQHFDAGKRR